LTGPGISGTVHLAIGVKPFPVLLLPTLAAVPGLTWQKRALLSAGCGGLVLIVTLPALAIDAPLLLQNVLTYQGTNDQELGGLLRALWLWRADNLYLPGRSATISAALDVGQPLR